MTTELKKFSDAYATLTVATYEPMILRWISAWSVHTIGSIVAWRGQRQVQLRDGAISTALAVNAARARVAVPTPRELAVDDGDGSGRGEYTAVLDSAGRPLAAEGVVEHVELEGFPAAARVGSAVFPLGVVEVEADGEEMRPRMTTRMRNGLSMSVRSVPVLVNRALGRADADFDYVKERDRTTEALLSAAKEAVEADRALSPALTKTLKDIGIYDFFPGRRVEEALSPIGIAHFYRQLYFNAEEGYGPIEEAFTVAPLETLEVVYQSVRRQIHEEVLELGSEQISEEANESKNTEEVSDKVSTMIQRDSSTSMSANASGSIGVWQAGASASADFKTSSQRSREETSRRLKEVTSRASERITKTFKLTTRDIDDVTTTNLTRRVIKNDSPHPVSYGLRRVLRRVRVKTQDIGPALVWQLYIRNPGEGLAQSDFVHFRAADPISIPEVPPGVPPRPRGGTDTGTTSSALHWDSSRRTWYAPVVVQVGADREVKAVSIDSITDLEGGGKDDPAPSPRNDVQWDSKWDPNTHTFTTNIALTIGDALSVSVNYTYTWDPAGAVLAEWDGQRQAEVQKLTAEAMNAQFERDKTLITERSKIRTRPPADLRREERYEIMNRMVSHLFARGADRSDPSPLEIEYFHRYMDINGMFVYTHPSWWKPRYAPVATSLRRPSYQITAQSEPGRMGSSLGWMIQLDGDTRRNEFLNSPWVRVCMPIREGREREAVQWLARHVEGEIGYDVNNGPLADLLTEVEDIRKAQGALGTESIDYVTVDTDVHDHNGGNALKPEDVYPVISEFEVTVPTDGFVYDELNLV
jgi:hypothetical protein